jgi:type VI secretion system secreted protein Hcp
MNYSIGDKVHSAGNGPLIGLKLGEKTLTPKNVAFAFQIESPRDASSGLASGKRQHKPIVITKETDSSSPLLFQHCASGQVIPKIKIEFLSATGGAGTHRFATLELTNAVLERHLRGKILPSVIKNPTVRKGGGEEIEEIEFTYQKIEWTWIKGGTTVADDWEARV